MRGGRANDVPGVTYSGIRGAFDFKGHLGKVRRRSFYGMKRPKHTIIHIAKRFRAQGISDVADIMSMRAY